MCKVVLVYLFQFFIFQFVLVFFSFFQFFISIFPFLCAILILNNMFVVVVLYCVQLLSEETFFLRLIITHQQKLINYIGCFIKTQLK